MNGIYQVSNLGRIKSLDKVIYQKNKNGNMQNVKYKGRILKPQKQKNGYLTVDLHNNGGFKRKTIHSLVAESFLENDKNLKYINHKDNNKENNKSENLEWCTQSYNIKYAYDFGKKKPPHMKSINQMKNGVILNTYISIMDAERQTGIKSSNISKCCRNIRNYAGGYQWKYTG